jgi:hypothetical protein
MKIYTFILFLAVQTSLLAQNGLVVGKVIEAENNEFVAMAPVYEVNMKYVTRTDFDGNYVLSLPPGDYFIKSRFVGLKMDSIKVTITSNDTIKLDLKMTSSNILNTVTITHKLEINSAASVLTAEKKAKTVTDGIGKEEMNDKDVSNAADAVKQVPGATVENGKYVYVRGLSDRYSKTLLNGADIPGLDPNRNSVQMDLFPSTLIQNITVYKTFSPDLPASFTGGLVNISTKEFPEKFTVNFSAKFGYNTQASLNNKFLTQNSSPLDNIAFGALDRTIPNQVFNLSAEAFPSPGSDNEKLNEYGKAFDRSFEPTRKKSGLNQSYTFFIGDSKNLKKNQVFPKLGYFVGTSYKKDFSYYDNGVQGRFKLTGNYNENSGLNPELDLKDEKGTESVIWGLLGNVSLQLNERHTFSLVVDRFQNGINSARYLEGHNYSVANDLYFQTRTLFYQQRELSNIQLKGQHYFFREKDADLEQMVKMNWIASYTNSVQKTPELKFFTNDYTLTSDSDTLYDLQPALYSDPSQFYRLMTETNLNTKIDFTIPFYVFNKKESNNILKVGGYYLDKYRTFNEKRYDFVQQSGNQTAYTGNVEDYVADDKFNAGDYTNGFLYVQNASEDRNNYIGYETNYSAYALTDLEIGNRIELRLGARVEKDEIFAKSQNINNRPGYLNNLDILPSVNGTYNLINDTLKLRVGYSRTIARPTFRELAPFTSFDFVGGNVYVGNPDLKRTLIDNFDIRLEFYPTYKENISIGVFSKNFTNPIERAFNPEAANAELTWRNVNQAKVYGFEIEFAKYLGTGNILKNLKVGGNLTYVKSIVEIPEKELIVIKAQQPNAKETREMFGQAPYIINTFINYRNKKSGLVANLNFGVSGKQISVVTIGATPNIYQQPRPLLGFNISKEIKQITVKFSAANLLNSAYLSTYSFKNQDYIYSNYTIGRTFSLKLSYNFTKK